jgi:hypothetical protein
MTKKSRYSKLDLSQAEMIRKIDGKASDSAYQLFHLANVVKLAGFACESRRILEGLGSPDIQAADDLECVSHSMQWIEHDDVTGDVLREAGKQLYEMANLLSELFGETGELEGILRNSGGRSS